MANPTQTRACDWRGQLARNSHKTIQVVFAFILIYLALGFFLDIYLHGGFVQNNFMPVTHSLLTLQIIPLATLSMGGVAILSLFITYALYDRIMLLGTNAKEITSDSAQSPEEKQLYNMVEELKIAAGMRYMPRIYIIDADYMNAFASGYSQKSAMIAVTRGLMNKLNRSELQAVMAHELSHIRHGDIKLTLTASVLSNLMLIVLDIFFYNAIFSRNSRQGGNGVLLVIILLRYLLPVISLLLMLYLSRTREYMADAGSVELMRDNTPLGKALTKISDDHQMNRDHYAGEYGTTPHEDVRRAAYIFDPVKTGIEPVKSFCSVFSTHPSIKKRLKAIGFIV